MQTLWFITNPASGSATAAKAEAIEALIAERGLHLAGRTGFPDDALPDRATLDEAGVDTVVLFAGDGTINAAACKLAEWDGALLILPGGTMNMLARQLHGDADPATIVHAAHDHGRQVSLPFVEAGRHRGFVGMILGPAASWVHARERVRERRLRGLGRAITHAWRRTFGGGIRLAGIERLRGAAQAVFLRPTGDGLDVRAIDAREWRAVATLGWEWLTGDWVAAAPVTSAHVSCFRVSGRKPVQALFDGEPVMLAADTEICGGATPAMFITTLGGAA